MHDAGTDDIRRKWEEEGDDRALMHDAGTDDIRRKWEEEGDNRALMHDAGRQAVSGYNPDARVRQQGCKRSIPRC